MTDYIHGYTQAEQQRLTLMQALVNDVEMAALDLGGARKILDVGSGLGQFTRCLARHAPGADVLGIERNERQIAEALRQAEAAGEAGRVGFRQGGAENLSLAADERGVFDIAHARFLLEHVPDPLAVVKEMVQAVRPGGRIILLDDDHELMRFWPENPALDQAWRVYWQSYRDHGLDPLIGRRMGELLYLAGAMPERAHSVFYGALRGMSIFDAVVDNLLDVIGGAVPGLVASGRMTEAQFAAVRQATRQWRSHPAACVWYSLPLVEGRRPA